MASIHVQEPVPEEQTTTELDSITTEEPDVASTSLQEAEPIQAESNPATPQIVHGHGVSVRQRLQNVPKTTLLVAIAFILLLGALLFVLKDRNNLKKETAKTGVLGESKTVDEAEELKKEVGSFLQLPDDETPTVATVVDAEKVKGQSFFANSKNGDKVLLFAQAGKAILYRPSTKKIIEVAPINLNNTQATDTNTTTTTKPANR